MPHKDWLYSSYSPKLTSRDSGKCRRIINSAWYKENWSDVFTVDAERRMAFERTQSLLMEDQNEKMNYKNLHSGSRIATSQGGTGTGEGGDIIVFDDPHKVGAAESELKREGTCDYWEDEMSTRGNDPKTVCRLVIMQRVHEKDLTARIKDGPYGSMYDHLVLPFEYDPKIYVDLKPSTSIGFKDPRTIDGERLWSRFDGKAGDDLKALVKPYQRTGQLQQSPTAKEGTIFKRDWFKKRWHELPPRFDHFICTWDLTFGTGEDAQKNASYDVGYALGWFNGDYYVVDELRERLEPHEQEEWTKKLRNKWKKWCHCILIENAANGKATAKKIRRKVSGVVLVTPEGSKEDRALSTQDVYRAGNVIFPEDGITPWAEDAVEEFISFGPRAKFKDRVDALTQGILHLEPRITAMDDLGDALPESIEKESIYESVGGMDL